MKRNVSTNYGMNFYFIAHGCLRLHYKGCRVKHAKRFVEFKTFPYTQVNPVVCKVQLIDRVSAEAHTLRRLSAVPLQATIDR